ncbi:aminotransferase [Talaromyces pinophilus]|uniref:Aminotransferase n=1 Tax=Talaromyces pinophilus TaxID=128442 RepID=A0A6V8H9F7_TALPI|nr:aminotransferase [Talaromyces pinophilus]
MAISSKIPRKVPFECFQPDNISWTTPAYAYRYVEPRESEDFTKRLLTDLDAHFRNLGPDNVTAFMAETVVGATTGCTTAPAGYFKGVREICDKYGILLILDAGMCGVRHTGTVSLMCSETALEAFATDRRTKLIPSLCAATLCVQKIIQRDGMIETCAQRGKFLESLLEKTFSDTKFPSGGGSYMSMAFELGVAMYPGMFMIDGTKGDYILLAPPYNVTESELRNIVEVMKRTYDNFEKGFDVKPTGQLPVGMI